MKTEPLTLSQANDEEPFWVGVFEWVSKGKIRVAAGPDCEVSVKRYAYCRRNLLFAPTLHGNFIMREMTVWQVERQDLKSENRRLSSACVIMFLIELQIAINILLASDNKEIENN